MAKNNIKVVIAGSASLQENIKMWIKYWNSKKDHSVLDYPKIISKDKFDNLYPDVHKNFFKNIAETDILFIANDKKKGINGYVGAETFAELGFGLAQKLVYGKNIKLILANMPGKEVACYDEIVLWNRLGWIDEILNH